MALFNGADEGDTALIDRVLARADAKGRPPPSAPACRLSARCRPARTLVLADTGVPARPGFDGDAHAGTLSFEMSHGRERLIVNCGAYQRSSADWRNVARATAAHSTLIVADTNSSELDAHGGLGRRPTHVPCERIEDGGSHWVSASHDGYQTVFGLTHARQLFLAADGEDLRGEDRLIGPAGRSFVIRFHLHPQVQASLIQDGDAALLRLPSGLGWRLRAQGAVMSLAESVYLGGGEMRKAQQVVLDGHIGSSGATVKWALRREAKKPADGDASQADASTVSPTASATDVVRARAAHDDDPLLRGLDARALFARRTARPRAWRIAQPDQPRRAGAGDAVAVEEIVRKEQRAAEGEGAERALVTEVVVAQKRRPHLAIERDMRRARDHAVGGGRRDARGHQAGAEQQRINPRTHRCVSFRGRLVNNAAEAKNAGKLRLRRAFPRSSATSQADGLA